MGAEVYSRRDSKQFFLGTVHNLAPEINSFRI